MAFHERSEYLSEWQRSRDSVRFKDDRVRAVVLRLHEGMINWLSGRGEPPDEKLILPPLRCKQRLARTHGAWALRDYGILEPDLHPLILRIFQKSSIRACETILHNIGRADRSLLEQITFLASDHKSPWIRREAVSCAVVWEVPDLLGFLARMRRIETDETVIASILMYQDLERQGYHAQFMPDAWSWNVWYRWFDESTPHLTHSCRVVDVPKIVVDAIGIERALQYIKDYEAQNCLCVPWDEIVEGA